MTKSKSCVLTPVAEHPSLEEVYEATPFSEAFWTYLNYIILNIFGWFRDFLRNTRIENRKGSAEKNPLVKTQINDRCIHNQLIFRVLFHCIKVMKVFILVMFINVFAIVSIDQSEVYPVENLNLLNV
jgi:hypothetical protein